MNSMNNLELDPDILFEYGEEDEYNFYRLDLSESSSTSLSDSLSDNSDNSDNSLSDNMSNLSSDSMSVGLGEDESTIDPEVENRCIIHVYKNMIEMKRLREDNYDTIYSTICSIIDLMDYVYNNSYNLKKINYNLWIRNINNYPCTITITSIIYLLRISREISTTHLESIIRLIISSLNPTLIYHTINSLVTLNLYSYYVKYNYLTIIGTLRSITSDIENISINYRSTCIDCKFHNPTCSNCMFHNDMISDSVVEFKYEIDSKIFIEFITTFNDIIRSNECSNIEDMMIYDAYVCSICDLIDTMGDYESDSLANIFDRFVIILTFIIDCTEIDTYSSTLSYIDDIGTVMSIIHDHNHSRYDILNRIFTVNTTIYNDIVHGYFYDKYNVIYNNDNNNNDNNNDDNINNKGINLKSNVPREVIILIKTIFERYRYDNGRFISIDSTKYFDPQFGIFMHLLSMTAITYETYLNFNVNGLENNTKPKLDPIQKINFINDIFRDHEMLDIVEELLQIVLDTLNTNCGNSSNTSNSSNSSNTNKINIPHFITNIIMSTMDVDIIIMYLNKTNYKTSSKYVTARLLELLRSKKHTIDMFNIISKILIRVYDSLRIEDKYVFSTDDLRLIDDIKDKMNKELEISVNRIKK